MNEPISETPRPLAIVLSGLGATAVIALALHFTGALRWPFVEANESTAAGISFLITVIGFPLTLTALLLGYQQIRKTKTAAEAASAAAQSVKFRHFHYEAAQHVHDAQHALDRARDCIEIGDWRSAGKFYEEVRRRIIKLPLQQDGLDPKTRTELKRAVTEISAICKKIDIADGGDRPWPEQHEIKASARDHFDVLARLSRHFQEKAL